MARRRRRGGAASRVRIVRHAHTRFIGTGQLVGTHRGRFHEPILTRDWAGLFPAVVHGSPSP